MRNCEEGLWNRYTQFQCVKCVATLCYDELYGTSVTVYSHLYILSEEIAHLLL